LFAFSLIVTFDADAAFLYPVFVVVGTLFYLAWCIRQSYKECYDDGMAGTASREFESFDFTEGAANIPHAVRRRAAAIAQSNQNA
jgi:hypothetical protein